MCDSSYCFYEILADCEYEQGAEKVLLRGRLQYQSPGIAKLASGKALPEEFKISFATHPSGSQIVFDDEYGDIAVLEPQRDAEPPLL
jgi:hypothetical protein